MGEREARSGPDDQHPRSVALAHIMLETGGSSRSGRRNVHPRICGV